ncbi:MAG TPA: molybdenum cofactor biosynthesis protein MoaE [Actinomycetota bacterium]|nr:molybdenum cofactor biosynthesis protein MoaE [Actinomycetota bacterium]
MVEAAARVVAAITGEPLDVAAAIAQVTDNAAGAVSIFVGTVRSTPSTGSDGARTVVRLDYDAHPELATEKLSAIATEAAGRWDLLGVSALHRTGTCEVGEPTVVIACSAPHRVDAIEACHWMIDEVKSSVPIWKQEVFADGSAWVE